MSRTIMGTDGNEYVLDDDEDDFDLDEPLTRAEFAEWARAQQDQPEWFDDDEDEDELSEEEEAYWDELSRHVESYERWRGTQMTQRELETFKERFDTTPPGKLVDTTGFYDQNNESSDKSAFYMAEVMEDLKAQEEAKEAGEEFGEGEGEAE